MRDLEESHRIGKARLLRRQGKTYDEIRTVIGDVDRDRLRVLLRGIPRPVETNRTGRAKPELQRKARQLRAQGMTYDEIGAVTGASVGSLSLWLSDMPLEKFAPRERQTQRFQEPCARSRERRLAAREASVLATAAEVGVLSDRELLLLGVALYWAEGSKSKPWRIDDRVAFINSDPSVILIFLKWLDLVGIERDRLILRLSIHESADVESAARRWSQLTGISPAQFGRPILKRHNPKTTRYNTADSYIGCLVIYVRRASELYRQIEGLWRGLAGP